MQVVKLQNPRRRHRRRNTKRNTSRGVSSATLSKLLSAVSKKNNPRRHRRRRHNVGKVVKANRRRYHRRRHNPSMGEIGTMLKTALYGAAGATLTGVGSAIVARLPFIGDLAVGNRFAEPAIQAAVAFFGVKWLGDKMFGSTQANMMATGGLVFAGLSLVNAIIPNVEGQLTSLITRPAVVTQTTQAIDAQAAKQIAVAAAATGDAKGAVDAVDQYAGFSDVQMGYGDVQFTPRTQ